jgi:hypothetical protein
MDQLPDIEMRKHFYFPVCNKDEIERVFNVQNINDYLLKLRADTIVDHMRLFRVYRNKAIINERNWSLEKSFSRLHYDMFLKSAKPEVREKCKDVYAGNIFSTDPNGQIFSTEKGTLITICDSLTFFLKFMNLGLMDFGKKVPLYVKVNSMRIAIRVMLQSESLDFFMDPRGILPREIADATISTIPFQMQFIAGHEYAHYVLGHLDDKNLIDKPILKAIFAKDKDYKLEKAYSYSQKNEFEADENSILLCNYNRQEKISVFESALFWYASLDLLEAVKDTISPPVSFLKTHPPARDRFENLLQKIEMHKGYNYKKWNRLLETVDEYKEFFINDVSLNIDSYEFYGSVYFDKPNTKWRGKELIDRVDYY